MESKVIKNSAEALKEVQSNSTIMSGGFGLCGIPENSITTLSTMPISNLTVISNNIGNSGRGLVKLLKNGQIKTAYCSYVGGNPDLEEKILNKEIEIHLIPQGTFSEKIRAAGAGIRAFYTPTGQGTIVEEGKEVKMFDVPCLLEKALHADFAIIKAQKSDTYGNLHFRETAQNFSPLMAMAAKVTIVEVEEIVDIGEMQPNDIHLPGIFVQKIYLGNNYENAIEFLKTTN